MTFAGMESAFRVEGETVGPTGRVSKHLKRSRRIASHDPVVFDVGEKDIPVGAPGGAFDEGDSAFDFELTGPEGERKKENGQAESDREFHGFPMQKRCSSPRMKSWFP